ncbi:MAG TPA: hypothetical protein VGD11_00845 [Mycobacteriales bacterium]|jgi:hypothetical protein|nr:hypothetical protein [Conexibacter sp.]
MSESRRGAPDARLPDLVDRVLSAARRWRAGPERWTPDDTDLEHRIWLELRDLQDCRDRPEGTDDLPAAASRLLDVVPPRSAFPPAAADLGAAIAMLERLREHS